MNCPSCSSLMYSLNDSVFTCPECHEQKIVRPHPRDRCPVCGEELEVVEAGFRCDRCIREVEARLNAKTHFKLNHGRHQRRINGGHNYYHPQVHFRVSITILLVVQLMLLVMAAPIAKAATETQVTLDLRPDPFFDDVAQVQDLSPDTMDVTTSLDIWRADLEEDCPNGTYYGTLFPGSAFEMNHDQYWWPDEDASELVPTTGRYTWVLVSGHFNLSSSIIMNGASQWWLKAPLLTSSMETSFGIMLCVFKGCPSTDYVGFYSTSYYHWWNEMMPRATWNGTVPTDLIHYRFMGASSGEDPDEGLDGATIKDDRLYLEVNSVIRPETDYVISLLFRMPIDGKVIPVFSGPESPAGMRSRISFADYQISEQNNGTNLYTVTAQDHIDLDLDLDWSLIFTEGIGHGGLFGHKFQAKWGTTVYLWPMLNGTTQADKHLSFMLPFISEDDVPMVPRVTNGIEEYGFIGSPPAWVADLAWTFIGSGADNPQFEWGDPDPYIVYYTYNDFFLFSTNWTYDVDHGTYPWDDDDRWNVHVQFQVKPYPNTDVLNITLLCYDDNRPTLYWSQLEPIETNSSKNPLWRPGIFQTKGWGEPIDEGSFYTLSYGVLCSAWGTDGEWAQVSMNDTGKLVYSYHFPNRVYLSPAEWTLERKDGSESSSRAAQSWDRAQDLWGEGHYVQAIIEGLKAAGYFLWDGGGAVVAWIKDGLSSIWEGMKSLGKWLWTGALKLWDRIISFLEDLGDILADFFESFVYLIGPLFMIGALAVTSRMGRSVVQRLKDWRERRAAA